MSTIAAIRLVLGDEELLAQRAVSEVIDAARVEDPGMQVHRGDAGDLTPGDLATMTSPTLFGGGSVVVVESAQDAKKDLAGALLDYAAAPAYGVYLVVVHAGGAKGKSLADGLRKAGAETVTVTKIKRPAERVSFVKEELKRLGARPAAGAAEELITAVGHDLRELANACAQLVADTGGKITVTEVNRYYRGRAEVTGFAVADSAVTGDVAGALGSLRWAMSIGLDAVPLADALATGVRNIAKVAGARGSGQQLAGRLGMAPWQVDKALQQARGWNPAGLVTAMQVTADLNAAVKGGAEDRGYALERAILAIAAARSQGLSQSEFVGAASRDRPIERVVVGDHSAEVTEQFEPHRPDHLCPRREQSRHLRHRQIRVNRPQDVRLDHRRRDIEGAAGCQIAVGGGGVEDVGQHQRGAGRRRGGLGRCRVSGHRGAVEQRELMPVFHPPVTDRRPHRDPGLAVAQIRLARTLGG